jgi:hypothetical protein
MHRAYIISCFFLFCGIHWLPAQDLVLVTDVKITFLVPARSEDKDFSTQITATLYTGSGKKVAMLDHCCGNIHYPDVNYTSSTYELDIQNTVNKTDMQNGYFDIHIDPAAAEKWMFIPTLQITFSDGSKSVIKGEDETRPYTKRLVTQDSPEATFAFHL